MKTIALIVLNYKDAKTTIKLVDQLVAWNMDEIEARFIVVDNHSPDDSFAVLSERYHHCRYVDVIQSEKMEAIPMGTTSASGMRWNATRRIILRSQIRISQWSMKRSVNA